jgi:hypothetical protein
VSMGFGVRIAPGVRISATRRGVRAGIGPRVARVHVGGGRPSISSGVGPVTVWQGIGTSRPRRSQRSPSLAVYERQARAALRSQQIEAVRQTNLTLIGLFSAHQQSFPDVTQPQVQAPEPIDEKAICADAAHESRRGVSFLDRRGRRDARQTGAEEANRRIEAERDRIAEDHRQRQAKVDAQWQMLVGNDPQVVLQQLETAFEDNQLSGAAVDCQSDRVTVVVCISRPEALVPALEVTTTPTGRPTTSKRTKTTINHLYGAVLMSQSLAVVKETLAVAPGINFVTVLVARKDDHREELGMLYVGTLARESLASVDWTGDCFSLLNEGLSNRGGRTGEWRPLSIDDPEIAAVLGELAEHLNYRPVGVPMNREWRPAEPARAPTGEKVFSGAPDGASTGGEWIEQMTRDGWTPNTTKAEMVPHLSEAKSFLIGESERMKALGELTQTDDDEVRLEALMIINALYPELMLEINQIGEGLQSDPVFDEDSARYWSWTDSWASASLTDYERRVDEQNATVARIDPTVAEDVRRRAEARMVEIIRRTNG